MAFYFGVYRAEDQPAILMTGRCATIPDYQSLMFPVLKLAGDGGEHRMLFYARRANAEGLSCPKRTCHVPTPEIANLFPDPALHRRRAG
jgi:hypothetical protein